MIIILRTTSASIVLEIYLQNTYDKLREINAYKLIKAYLQLSSYQAITKPHIKRCLIGFQKGIY